MSEQFQNDTSIVISVWFTYNEDSNAIIATTGDAIQINNGQKYRALSEYSMDICANGDKMYSFWAFTRVCLLWANQWIQKETEKVEEKLAWAGPMMPLKIPCGGVNRNCTLKDICACFCKEEIQFENDELNMEQCDVKLHEYYFTAQ